MGELGGANKKAIDIASQSEAFTLAAWPFGLGIELGQISSFIRLGRVGSVGVEGWKLVVADSEEPGGVDSNSLWRSLILCRSSFKYSIASPRIEALSICQQVRTNLIIFLISENKSYHIIS